MSHPLTEKRIWFEINTPLGCGRYTEDDLRRAYDLGFKAGKNDRHSVQSSTRSTEDLFFWERAMGNV